MYRTVLAASVAMSLVSGAGAAEKLGYPARELLVTGTDVLDQPIVYPAGTPRITSAIVTIAPGGEGQLHRHQVPMYAYVLQGAVTVDYGERGTKVFRQGEAVMEAQHLPHKGMNKGTEPVALLVVYMGAEGTPNATPVE
ncbi:MAG: cupin domain-containing protein [Sphingomonadales bacterium]